jgi:ribosomal protein L11 methyltransferase
MDLPVDATRCLQVDVDREEVDLVSALLWAAGATAVQEIELRPERLRLVAGIPAASEAGLVRTLFERGWRPDAFDAIHDGWLDAWRPFARPVRAGRVVVYPPWEPPPWPDLVAADPCAEADIVVPIDPGRAFGQGSHATTRLVLTELDRRCAAERPAAVLDVGCGSGVLGVVAAVLGVPRVVAVDIDPEAIDATRANAATNGVSDRLIVSATPLGELPGERFPLVLANILAPVLIELAPAIAARVAPGGALLLSGVQRPQRVRVLDAYGRAEPALELVGEATDGDWCGLWLARGS